MHGPLDTLELEAHCISVLHSITLTGVLLFTSQGPIYSNKNVARRPWPGGSANLSTTATANNTCDAIVDNCIHRFQLSYFTKQISGEQVQESRERMKMCLTLIKKINSVTL